MDYEKLGLKCGIEIHQQLDTTKLFCECGSDMKDEPIMEIMRNLRAVAGELGELDPAAIQEAMKRKFFLYRIYPNESCLVEMDCEPPHLPNQEALNISLMISMMLNCWIPNEIHFMRKQVIDGSNTSGFQRTAIVGLNGKIKTKTGEVGITNVCLEEDAAQIIERSEKTTVYGLNRLGIPLIEIGTTPDIKTPEQAREVASYIGMILRSTGRVKRGIGTIRQDINISIRGGARVEIKGAQELNLIPKLVENEVKRQLSLLEIREKLKSNGFKPIKPDVVEVTEIFKNAESKITKNKRVFAMKIPRFAGFFNYRITPTRRLGQEIASYVKAKLGFGGFIHDEEPLDKYGLDKHFLELKKALKAKKGDTVLIVSGDEETCRKILEVIAERVNLLLKGVPEETRRALENGDTEYMRPLPGSARLYPETDIPPIVINEKVLSEVKDSLPELIEDKIKRIAKTYSLSLEEANQIVRSGRDSIFERLVSKGIEPKMLARALTSTLAYLKRKYNIPVDSLTDSRLEEIFIELKNKEITKEMLEDILKECITKPQVKVSDILKSTSQISREELEKLIEKIVLENKELLGKSRPEKVLMGIVMARVRGKAPGKLVMDILQKKIKAVSKENSH